MQKTIESSSNDTHRIQSIMFSITLILQCNNSIDHILRNAGVINIFSIFIIKFVECLSISILDNSCLRKNHIFYFGNIRQSNQDVSGKPKGEYNQKKSTPQKRPKNQLLFFLRMKRRRMSTIPTSYKIRRIQFFLLKIIHG